jgi:hypothetical protein
MMTQIHSSMVLMGHYRIHLEGSLTGLALQKGIVLRLGLAQTRTPMVVMLHYLS